MAFTLGTTGMDSATEAELHAAFQSANAGSGNRWQLVSENDADFVVVDMDSMYGPMSWLRLHAAGGAIESLPAWLTTVTTRLCLDRLRARTPVPDGEIDPGSAPDPADEVALVPRGGSVLLVWCGTMRNASSAAGIA